MNFSYLNLLALLYSLTFLTFYSCQISPPSSTPAPLAPMTDQLNSSPISSPFAFLSSIPFRIFKKAYPLKGNANPEGLVGQNLKGWIQVGLQRGGMTGLRANLILNDQINAERNWKSLEQALQHLDSSGEFEQTIINGKHPDPQSYPRTTAFFLAEACESFLLLPESPLKDIFQQRLQSFHPKLSLAINHLAQKGSLEYLQQDSKATNRTFIYAKALLFCGKWDANPLAMAAGQYLLQLGLGRQQTDGVFPENGGGDSSYQAVSLLKLSEIFLYLGQDPLFKGALSSQLLHSLQKGTQWELARINNHGEVTVNGNTRTGLGQETYFGKPKEINYTEVTRYLALTGKILQDAKVEQAAEWVANHDK